jgi:trehalose 6-phosphate phosphatase
VSKSLLADIPVILQKLRNSDRIVLALDFDGTLAPIVDRPGQAAIPPGTASVLCELASSKRISIVIVSGRSIADLNSKLDF